MPGNSGWIRLHRQIMDSPEWLAEPFTRGQAWVDLLLLANHSPGFIRKRGVMVAVDRGMIGYSEDALAERWKWSRGKVRRFFAELARLSQVSRKISEKTVPKNTSVSSLIYIENYDKYQADSTESSTEDGRKTVQEQEEKEEKENTPAENLSGKILKLKNRYQDSALIDQALSAICSTRKSNKISDGVLLAVLEKMDRYPVNQVEAGIKVYLGKSCAADGKNEKYLMGIIKNQNGATAPKEKRTPEWL
jgi:hypothetical protein